MRRIVILIAAAAFAATLAGQSSSPAETPRGPALRLVDRNPVTLKGEHFRSRELVRLSVKTDSGAATRRVRARVSGLFVSELGLALDRCSGLYAVAVGARGSRATLKLVEPACPPEL